MRDCTFMLIEVTQREWTCLERWMNKNHGEKISSTFIQASKHPSFLMSGCQALKKGVKKPVFHDIFFSLQECGFSRFQKKPTWDSCKIFHFLWNSGEFKLPMNCFFFTYFFGCSPFLPSGVPVKQESCENLTITSKIHPSDTQKKPSAKAFWPLETVGGFSFFAKISLSLRGGKWMKMMILERSKIIFKSYRAGSLLPLPMIKSEEVRPFFSTNPTCQMAGVRRWQSWMCVAVWGFPQRAKV